MFSSDGKAAKCYVSNVDYAFAVLAEDYDVNFIVGHIHNGQAYLTVQEKENDD